MMFGCLAYTIFVSRFKSLCYPKQPKKEGRQGMAVVQFNVGTDGKLNNVHVMKPVDPELDAEAIRVVQAMKPWRPSNGKDGHPVAVNFALPVKFELPTKK